MLIMLLNRILSQIFYRLFMRRNVVTFSLSIFLTLVGFVVLLHISSKTYASTGFVTRSGTKFMLDGNEFRFVGFNLFDAANTYFPEQGKTGYSCPRDNGWWSSIYTEADLDQELAFIKQQTGATVLRFWAFQRYTNGGTDWSGIDKVIRVAKKNGLKVLPVLEDGPGYCTYPEPAGNAKWKYNNDTWYTDGYKLKMGNYSLTYPDYVRAIVTRYKDEPTIMGWMMMNEADTSRKTNGIDGSGPSVLVNFAKDIGTLIKSIDTNHLVTVGTQSNGASGATGADFVQVYNVKDTQGRDLIDFTEVHDWPYWGGDTDPLPGSPDGHTLPNPDSADCLRTYQAKLACSIANSIQKLNKPIIMGEAGIAARSDSERIRRADLMDKKMAAFFNAGGAGYLVWQWNKVIDSEGFDVQMTTNDPLLAKMKKYAGYQPGGGSTCTKADINGDKQVNLVDYSLLVASFLKLPVNVTADINNDGQVNLSDYSLLVAQFLKPCQ